jgi:asparagine synthase (glutamine-hydrolysing)
MPGLAGCISTTRELPTLGLAPMLKELGYGRAMVTECYQESQLGLGCVHLGTGGQRALYQSDQAVVGFFGYLTEPAIPPGANESKPAQAAQYIHDLYLAQSDKMMRQIAGAFAIAIWDRRTQSLLLISDYLGLRPIYYSVHNGIFRFASEVKGILADPQFPHSINKAAFADFFQYGHLLQAKTFFEDIQLVPSASVLRLQDSRLSVDSYWDISYSDRHPPRPERWYDDLINDAIHSSIKKMIRPEIKYGLSLSGGLDSRWIAAYLSKYRSDSLAFTVGIPDSDDTPIAKQVAEQTGLSHHYYWGLSTDFVAEMGATYTYLVDGMDNLDSMGEFPLSTQVGNSVDVAVGGLLGGPIFGYYIDPLSAILRRQDVMRYFLWRTGGDQEVIEQAFGLEPGRDFRRMAISSLQACLDPVPNERGYNVLQVLVLRNHQHRSVNFAQLAKLAFVDIYHPLADKEVVTAASQLPVRQLILEEAYRRAMVTHFPDLGKIPWTYTMTPPSISMPAAVLKKTAQHTLGKWLRTTPLGGHPFIRPRRYYTNYSLWSRGPLRSFIEETLLSPESNAAGLFNQDGLRTVIRDHMEGRRNATTFILRALAVALWTRLFYIPSTPIRPGILNPDKWQEQNPLAGEAKHMVEFSHE